MEAISQRPSRLDSLSQKVSSSGLTLVACILASGIAFLDGTLVNVGLPAISRSLGGGLEGQQWIVDGYLLSLGALVLIGGSLGDLLGRRRVLATGVGSFGLLSALCAFAPSIDVLVVFRVLQGVTAALLVPNSLALVADTFAEHARARAIGTWTSWTGTATIAGPLVGGVIVDSIGWRWVFVVNVPIAAATLVLLRSHASQRARLHVRIDWPGAGLSALGLGVLTFALIDEPSRGWSSPLICGSLAVGFVLLVGFVVREHLCAAPMMPLSLFRSRNFAAGNLATFALYGAVPAANFFLVLFLQQVRGMSALAAGAALLPTTIMIFLFANRFGALGDGIGPRIPMTAGPLIAAVGLGWLLELGSRLPYLAVIVPGTTVLGLGLAISVAPLTSTVMSSVGQERDGLASGINNAVSRVGGLIAIATIGALLAARFASSVQKAHGLASAAAASAASHPLSIYTSHFPASQRVHARHVLDAASIQALRLALEISIGLAVLAGLAAYAGIRSSARDSN